MPSDRIKIIIHLPTGRESARPPLWAANATDARRVIGDICEEYASSIELNARAEFYAETIGALNRAMGTMAAALAEGLPWQYHDHAIEVDAYPVDV